MVLREVECLAGPGLHSELLAEPGPEPWALLIPVRRETLNGHIQVGGVMIFSRCSFF
jgi:hypothetical protein